MLVDAALQAHSGDPRLHQVLFEESPRPPVLLAELRALQATLVGFVADLLREDPDQDVADPRLIAWFLVVATEALTHRYLADRPTDDVSAFRDGLLTLLTGFLDRSS